eukprot:COSAG02_NODE_1957_length_10261_cov_51.399134_1_plen_185_part_10
MWRTVISAPVFITSATSSAAVSCILTTATNVKCRTVDGGGWRRVFCENSVGPSSPVYLVESKLLAAQPHPAAAHRQRRLLAVHLHCKGRHLFASHSPVQRSGCGNRVLNEHPSLLAAAGPVLRVKELQQRAACPITPLAAGPRPVCCCRPVRCHYSKYSYLQQVSRAHLAGAPAELPQELIQRES